MKKKWLMAAALIISLAAILFIVRNEKVEQTITFFPIDPTVSFTSANTNLKLLDRKEKNAFSLRWTITSILDRKAFLRQDAGLLFANGRLIGEQSKWKEKTAKLFQEEEIIQRESSLFQGISFHQAELHEKTGVIKSAQTLSSDHLYVVRSKNNQWTSFRRPMNRDDIAGKKMIDRIVEKELENSWRKAASAFSINLKDYRSVPLIQLTNYGSEALKLFSKEKQERIIGNLWEGLYKNYLLGIKKGDGTVVESKNSTIPLILIANNQTHLLVLFETGNQEPMILRQMIQ